MVREVCRYFVFTEQFEKGMQLLKHSIDCTLLPNYKTQPFRLLLWKYSEAATFFAIYSISSKRRRSGNGVETWKSMEVRGKTGIHSWLNRSFIYSLAY